MRVAVVLAPGSTFSNERPNSIEVVARTLARASAYRDETVIVCDEGSERCDLPSIAIPAGLDRRRRTSRVIAALKSWRPDVLELHQHGPTSARIARAFPAVPSLIYRHNETAAPRTPIDRLRYMHRYGAFDAHVFVSDYLRRAFARVLPSLASRGVTIRNPIDAGPWVAPVEARQPLIAFTGRAAPEKGFDLLCSALATVLERRPDWRAELLVRDWHAHSDWAHHQTLKLLPFGDRVSVRRDQPVAAVRDLLGRAAIAVLPSVFPDPFPLANLEAHAAGAAVISSGAGGLKEASGVHALYVEPIEAAGLAMAIERLIADPAERLRLARNGQAAVIAEHTPERRAAELDALRLALAERRWSGSATEAS